MSGAEAAWRFGAEVPQRIVALVLKWPGRFGAGTLGGLGPAKPRHRGGLGPTKLGLQRIGPREAEPHSYSGAFLKGIRGNDNDGRGGESRWLHQAYFAQREPPGRDGKICSVGSVEHGRIRPAGSVERGKIRSSCMI
mgnify:CR=1 FL=1